jgi:hypothetical protein
MGDGSSQTLLYNIRQHPPIVSTGIFACHELLMVEENEGSLRAGSFPLYFNCYGSRTNLQDLKFDLNFCLSENESYCGLVKS